MSKKKQTLLSRVTAAMGITHSEPEITQPEPPSLSTRAALSPPPAPSGRCFWPADKPLPTEYVRVQRRTIPCPNCRRVLLDTGSQAVALTSAPQNVTWFRCRSCGHRWKMPNAVREV